MDLNEARREILNRVANGELSAETADRLLTALDDDIFQPEAQNETPEVFVEPAERLVSEALPPSTQNDSDDRAGQSDPEAPADGAASFSLTSTSSPSPDIDRVTITDPIPEVTVRTEGFQRSDSTDETDDEMKRRVARWQRAWVIPFLIGLSVTILGAFWMYRGWLAAGLSWGFWLSWIPFLLGIGLAVFAFASTEMPWLHLSVDENHTAGGTHIHFTFPLPIQWAAWVMTHFDRFMPKELRDKNVADFLALFEQSIEKDQPFHIVVDEEDEHVDIAIFKM